MTLSGIINEIGGWPLIFYVFGGAAIVFSIPWIFLVYDSPDKHPRISEAEKKYILSSTQGNNEVSITIHFLVIYIYIYIHIHIYTYIYTHIHTYIR